MKFLKDSIDINICIGPIIIFYNKLDGMKEREAKNLKPPVFLKMKL